ncbi:hypothetical protein [Nocardioides sp.]|uniref:hypothetical protein n=1 Tax=Nocardioides sp. TaxID=35761 RepID=UPI003518860C
MTGSGRAWVADPGIAWRILLRATWPTPSEAPSAGSLARAQDLLHAAQGWARPEPVALGPARTLQDALATAPGESLLLGLDTDAGTLVVSGHHRHLDGLGLLAVLAAVTGLEIASDARGIGERPAAAGPLRGALARLGEALLAPPARPDARGGRPGDPGEAWAERTVLGTPRTRDLVAAVRGGPWAGRRTAVAVGVSRRAGVPAPGTLLADHSALLRLRGVERLDDAALTRALREAAPEPSPDAGGGSRVAALQRPLLRALAPRLGSTLLVSHLGVVAAPGLASLAFAPVTAGGSGLSLGAVTLHGTGTGTGTGSGTVLTLRGRAARWSDEALERLLEGLTDQLTDQTTDPR